MSNPNTPVTTIVEPPSQGKRLLFLDALRGFTMFWIIGGDAIVRSINKVWPNTFTTTLANQMKHAIWEGFTFIDLIFPLFLLIVGAVLPYAILGRLEKGQSRASIYPHIFKRTFVLIFLGLINYGLLQCDWSNMRWSTLLGRIGICYCVASIILLHTNWKTQAIIAAGLIFLYWAAMMFIPVPGHGAGVLTPQGSLSTYLDQLLIPGKLGVDNLYDRQGVISTFTSIATTLIGVLIGHWLKSERSDLQKLKGMFIAAIILIIAGGIWGKFFLISRNIWTSTFVLYSAGWGLLLFALFYWVIDIAGIKKWSLFFIVIGTNAITIWVGQRIVNFDGISSCFFGGMAALYFTSVAPVILACGTVMAKWLVLWVMYKHKIFLKA
jgi:predicted acyltransferase